MKLSKTIKIAGEYVGLVSEDVRLGLFTPGRASFSVVSAVKLTGLVVFSMGYTIANIKPYFIGYVDSCTQVSKNQMRVFCRELTAALAKQIPLALRDVTLAEVLATISEITSLELYTTDTQQAYTANKAPAFYSFSNGYFALDAIAKVYGVEKLIWQQQTDGRVYVGSWNDSYYATRAVELPTDWETSVAVANGATIPCVPNFRPGVQYNGNVLTDVQLAGANMKLNWAVDPWAVR